MNALPRLLRRLFTPTATATPTPNPASAPGAGGAARRFFARAAEFWRGPGAAPDAPPTPEIESEWIPLSASEKQELWKATFDKVSGMDERLKSMDRKGLVRWLFEGCVSISLCTNETVQSYLAMGRHYLMKLIAEAEEDKRSEEIRIFSQSPW